MDARNETLTALAQQIEQLRAEICPDTFRYTHEFLQLASVAAQREGHGAGMNELAHPLTTH